MNKIENIQPAKTAKATAKARELVSPIQLLSNRALRGVNIHYEASVIQQLVTPGDHGELTSAQIGGDFVEQYLQRFSTLKTLIPGTALSKDFVKRLKSAQGVPIIEALFEAILALDMAAKTTMQRLDKIEFAQIVADHASEQLALVWSTRTPQISTRCARVAMIGLGELLRGVIQLPVEPVCLDYRSEFDELMKIAVRNRLSVTTSVIMQTAIQRGIPCSYLGNTLLRFGQGNYQRHIWSSSTDKTSYSSTLISRHKYLTNQRLMELRLPVPQQIRVASAKETIEAAKMIGYPVVVKPLKGKKGRGISVGVRNKKEASIAYANAAAVGDELIVEQFISGHDHRLLIIGGRFIAALTREPPMVTGDGKSKISRLIEKLNEDPCRDGIRLYQIVPDKDLDFALSKAGYTLSSVLDRGVAVALHTVPNISLGGSAIDVTDKVHPDNRDMAIRAARGIGLDVAGIDFLTTDISRSYKEVGGGIVEVNFRPGLCIHTWPRKGVSRDVSSALIDQIIPPTSSGHIPSIMIMGDIRTAVVARDVDELLRSGNLCVGLAIRNTAYVNGRSAELKPEQGRKAARLLLRDNEVEVLVSTVAPRAAITRGLQLDRCDVAAIMDPVSEGDLEYGRGLDILARANRGRLVIGEQNQTALDLVTALDPKRLVLVSPRGLTDKAQKYLKSGSRVATIDWVDGHRMIHIHKENRILAEVPVMDHSRYNETNKENRTVATGATGHRSQRIEIRLFAVAIAHSYGMSSRQIAEGMALTPLLKK